MFAQQIHYKQKLLPREAQISCSFNGHLTLNELFIVESENSRVSYTEESAFKASLASLFKSYLFTSLSEEAKMNFLKLFEMLAVKY